MNVGAVFVAGAESLEGVQPGEAAFDDPALAAQAGAVRNPAAGDAWGDAAGAELAAVLVVVVAAVGEQLPRSPSGASAPAADRRHGVDQRNQLGDVVAVAAGEGDCERDAAGVADQMVLGTRAATVDR